MSFDSLDVDGYVGRLIDLRGPVRSSKLKATHVVLGIRPVLSKRMCTMYPIDWIVFALSVDDGKSGQWRMHPIDVRRRVR